MSRSPAIRGLRLRERRPGSADRPSLACSGIGAIPRADPAGLIARHSPRRSGPRLGDILPQKQKQEQREPADRLVDLSLPRTEQQKHDGACQRDRAGYEERDGEASDKT